MINRMATLNKIQRRILAYLYVMVAVIGAGCVYYMQYFFNKGYLPSPFLYDKSNTFMDLFNPLYWAFDAGRYTDWGSVYPPLNFLILRVIHFVFAGGCPGDPELMRDNSPLVIAGICLIYLAIPAFMLKTRHWREISNAEKLPVYLAIILSTPMLFVLERGNVATVLCLILLTIILSKIGFVRCIGIALLINLKPYFALLMFYYIARQNWKALATCTALSGLFFTIPGLALDNHFLVFFKNIFSFSQEEGLFSLREAMSLPSSISAFSYVLKNQDGAMVASELLASENIVFIVYVIEMVKWGTIVTSFTALMTRSKVMRDAEIIILLIVAITNLGVWVGGYTLIYYVALIPVLIKMRARWLYIVLLATLAMPLDIVPLMAGFIGNHYSYLSGSAIDVQWTLGLGSVVRPVVNIILLMLLSCDFLARRHKCTDNYFVYADLFMDGCGIVGERSRNAGCD